jgi:hemerythrin-like domain-containing protein
LMKTWCASTVCSTAYCSSMTQRSGGFRLMKILTPRWSRIPPNFIENYHEKSEEDFLFPRFRKANQLVDLVTTLSEQHQAGRTVTRKILDTAGQVRGEAAAKQNCISAMQAFVTMYRPHAAREDTVLFPKLREIVSGHEFDAIGEEMEKREHQHFGEDGFEKAVAQVAEIEKKIGLYDLAQFTPKKL